jgi:hypothetical protein
MARTACDTKRKGQQAAEERGGFPPFTNCRGLVENGGKNFASVS